MRQLQRLLMVLVIVFLASGTSQVNTRAEDVFNDEFDSSNRLVVFEAFMRPT
jgi:hypothetical protein